MRKAQINAFTAVMVERDYGLLQSEPDHVQNYVHAVNAEGSYVDIFKRQFANHEWGEMKVVFDVRSRKRVAVDPSTKSLTTYSLSDRMIAAYLSRAAQCTGEAAPEHGTLLGYDVVKKEINPPARPGEIRQSQQWLAPVLDCFALKQTNTYGSSSGAHRTTIEALSVTSGNPDPSLFEVPGDYIERSPSEVSAEHVRRFGGQPIMGQASAKGLDDVYHRTNQRNR